MQTIKKTPVLVGVVAAMLLQTPILHAQKQSFARLFSKPTEVKKIMPQTNDVLTLYGMNITNTGGHAEGIYSFTATDPISYTQLFQSDGLRASGGDYANGHAYFDADKRRVYFCNWLALNNVQCNYYVYDTEDWTEVYHDLSNTSLHPAALAISKDPTTGTIYGIFKQERMLGKYDLGTIVYYDDRRPDVTIIKSDIGFIRTLACDANGQLYGIQAGYDGENNSRLCKIDKKTGSIETVGTTGIPVFSYPGADQSMAFDPNTGDLYWAAKTTTKGYLLKVDPLTAETALIAEMSGQGDEFVGLYIPKRPEADAPADITNLRCTYNKGNTSGRIIFSLPTTTYGGETLTGPITYTITNHSDIVVTGTAEPGDNIREQATLEPGMACIEVTAANEAGTSNISQSKFWVGPDTPQKVNDLLLTIDGDGTAHLSWTAPATGIHGGYVDSDQLTYNIVRHPGNVTVAQDLAATTFEETLETGLTTGYFYEVIPFYATLEGVHANSNHQYVGDPYETPFHESMGTEESWMKFETVDANADDNTWFFDQEQGQASYYNASSRNADDWLFTPPIHLSPDYVYNFGFIGNGSAGYVENFDVTIGTDAQPGSHRVLSSKSQNRYDDMPHNTEVRVEADGIYRLGIHLTVCDQLSVSEIAVESTAYLPAPGQATDITVTPASQGQLEADITFHGPTTTLNGTAISATPRIEIRRGLVLVATVTDVPAGQSVTIHDDGNKMDNGMQTYRIISHDAEGHIGGTATVSAYVGIDNAQPVQNVVLTRDGADRLRITWDELPATGIHGGYVPTDRATYTIVNTAYKEIATVYADQPHEYLIDVPQLEGGDEELLYFGVRADIDGIEGDISPSNAYLKGKPFTLPVSEPFGSGDMSMLWWTENNSNQNIYWSSSRSSNDDGYCIGIIPQGNVCDLSLNSWSISLAGTKHPVLSLDYRFEHNGWQQLQIEAVDDQFNHVVLATLTTPQTPGDGQWHPLNLPLDKLLDAHIFYIRFHVLFEDAAPDGAIFLDNMRFYDSKAHDLACQIKTPASLTVSQQATFDITVDNHGHEAARDFTVNLYAGDRLVDSKTSSVDAYAVSICQLAYTPVPLDTVSVTMHAEIDYADDEQPADNRSKNVTLPVYQTSKPAITDLTGQCTDDGLVTLTWSPLDTPKDVVEGFEDYEPYIIDTAGNWTFVNGIDAPSSGFVMGLHVGSQARVAGLVYDSKDFYGPDDNEFGAYDGTKGAILLGNMAGMAHDGWLISPQLSAKAQTITFQAHSQYQYDLPDFEVSYSTATADTADFKNVVLTVKRLPFFDNQPYWQEYTFDVPEGANYFAIHDNTSEDVTARGICLDHITFNIQGEQPTGFVVYRDGREVGRIDASHNTFSEQNSQGGTYYVVACYGDLLSPLSNPVVIDPITGIRSIGEPSSSDAAVYDLFGRRLSTAPSKGIVVVKGKKVSLP